MDQDVWNRENGQLAQGVRMVAAALVSAVLTATIVIAVGQSMVDRQAPMPPSTPDGVLIRASN